MAEDAVARLRGELAAWVAEDARKFARINALEARVEELERAARAIADSWDNPPPAARRDVRYQQAVMVARAAIAAGADEGVR
jgi:ferric-dicitrate binding protein FerR (iron transport regulator)